MALFAMAYNVCTNATLSMDCSTSLFYDGLQRCGAYGTFCYWRIVECNKAWQGLGCRRGVFTASGASQPERREEVSTPVFLDVFAEGIRMCHQQ